MSVLVDTNVLLRSAQPTHPFCSQAVHAVSKLIRQNEMVFFCFQNIAEFWNVATRPSGVNGLGMTHEEVLQEVANIEATPTLLPDLPGIYTEWKRIVKAHKVQGVKVYDARLVALANIHGVSAILTFNIADFKHYESVKILDPLS